MPKASSTSNSTRPALRRNQACRSCRRRKLKCDAARPHCGTCVKQWQTMISVQAPPGYAHPAEPQCSYDPVEGLTLAPDTDPVEKIRQLEEEKWYDCPCIMQSHFAECQLAQLKTKLETLQSQSVALPQSALNTGPHAPSTSRQSDGIPAQGQSNDAVPGIALPRASLDLDLELTQEVNSFSNNPVEPERDQRPRLEGASIMDSPLIDLIMLGWNPDLPDPEILHHFVALYFKWDPCSSRVLHRSSFLASMQLSPRDSMFPHSAILHAICASASRWSATSTRDDANVDPFAEYHASKTRQYIDKTMASGEDIFPVMQACAILSWYFYQEGRWVEVWIFAGFQTRVAVPLRLNYPGTFSSTGPNSPGAYMGPPKDLRDLESRRRTWWMAIIFDRVASVGGWIHGIDERDLGTEFPLRYQDFEADLQLPNNPQDLITPNLFTNHPPQYTDSFLLFLKGIMLFGRVTDFNVRGGLRGQVHNTQNPFFIPGFEELDMLVSSDFLNSLPQAYRNNYGVGNAESILDTDLYTVHLIPHAAAITLHNPFLIIGDPENKSQARCLHASLSILTACNMVSMSSFDISRLHPFVVISWYLAAVIQVQLCKHLIEIGDTEAESTAWTNINMLRFAMLEYGNRSPIGVRQERLLQGVMTDIVRLTAQREPLRVGVPLYPFSHAGVFGKKRRAKHTNWPAFGVDPEPSVPFPAPAVLRGGPPPTAWSEEDGPIPWGTGPPPHMRQVAAELGIE